MHLGCPQVSGLESWHFDKLATTNPKSSGQVKLSNFVFYARTPEKATFESSAK
jgi:hypothetical protein